MSTSKHPWTKHAATNGTKSTHGDFARTGYGGGSRDGVQPEHPPHFSRAHATGSDAAQTGADTGKHSGSGSNFGKNPHDHRSSDKHLTRH